MSFNSKLNLNIEKLMLFFQYHLIPEHLEDVKNPRMYDLFENKTNDFNQVL